MSLCWMLMLFCRVVDQNLWILNDRSLFTIFWEAFVSLPVDVSFTPVALSNSGALGIVIVQVNGLARGPLGKE